VVPPSMGDTESVTKLRKILDDSVPANAAAPAVVA
jgi:hypothetical protein